jgi:pimeloyl-ACP methyl ester carboxylesterase
MDGSNPNSYERLMRRAAESATTRPPLKGTYFFGGAGFNGGYIQDMLSALREAGISNVFSGSNKESIGRSTFGDMVGGYLAMGGDATAVPFINQPSGYYRVVMSDEFGTEGSQFNLIGYSYGSIVAAVKALSYANVFRGTVDHVVLIGAPIEESLLQQLRSNSGIKKVIVVDLKQHGDPIYAGITDFELVKSAPELVGQMTESSGHFWYAPATPDGAKRRRELAKYLYDQGLR